MASSPHTDGDQPAAKSTQQVSANNTSTKQSAPAVDYKQEVRFAVVMYGGVSLAIYINGIAQESASLGSLYSATLHQ